MTQYIRAFFHHPILLILPIIVALVVSVGTEVRKPRIYQASVSFWCDTPVPGPSSMFAGSGDQQPAASQLVVLTEFLHTETFLLKLGQSGPWAGYVKRHSQVENEKLLFALAGDVSAFTTGP